MFTKEDICAVESNLTFPNEFSHPNQSAQCENGSQIFMVPLPYGIIISCISIFGTLFNILTLFVVLRVKSPTSFKILLVAMTAFDLIFCIGRIPNVFVAQDLVSRGWTVIFMAISNFGQFGSSFSTIGLTIERYMAVCKPLRHLVWWSPKRTAVILIFGIILNLLRYSFYTYYFFMWYCESLTFKILKLTMMTGGIFLVVETLLSGFIVICCNILILRVIQRANVQRNQMSSKSPQNEDSCTKLTQIIVACFLVLHTFPRILGCILYFLYLYTPSEGTFVEIFRYLHLLTALNCAIIGLFTVHLQKSSENNIQNCVAVSKVVQIRYTPGAMPLTL